MVGSFGIMIPFPNVRVQGHARLLRQWLVLICTQVPLLQAQSYFLNPPLSLSWFMSPLWSMKTKPRGAVFKLRAKQGPGCCCELGGWHGKGNSNLEAPAGDSPLSWAAVITQL